MANGIFLATAMFNGEPTLFQYTMRPDDPVVIVERYRPSKEELVPRPVSIRQYLKDTGVISESSVQSSDYYSPSGLYFAPNIAQRLVERVGEDAVLERSLADCIASEIARIGQEQWDKMLAEHEVNKIPTQEEWNATVKRIISKVRGTDA